MEAVMATHAYGAAINLACAIVLAYWAHRQRHRNPDADGVFLLCVQVGLWSIFYVLWQQSSNPVWAHLFAQCLMVPAALICHSIFRCARRYSGTTSSVALRTERILQITGYVIAAGALVPGLVVRRMEPGIAETAWWPIGGPLFAVFVVCYLVAFIGGISLVLANLWSRPWRRGEAWRLALSSGIGGIGGMTNMPAWFYPNLPGLPPSGNILVSVMVIPLVATFLRAQSSAVHPRVLQGWALASVSVVVTWIIIVPIGYESAARVVRFPSEDSFVPLTIIGVFVTLAWVSLSLNLSSRFLSGLFSPEVLSASRTLKLTRAAVHRSSAHQLGEAVASALRKELQASRVVVCSLPPDGLMASIIGSSTDYTISGPLLIPQGVIDIARREDRLFSIPPKYSELQPFSLCSPVIVSDRMKFCILIGEPKMPLVTEAMASAIDATALEVFARLSAISLAKSEADSNQLRELGTMAATLAHDFRNPLATVKTYIQEPASNPEAEEIRALAQSDLSRMEAAVYSVLELADPRRGSLLLDMREVLNRVAILNQTELSFGEIEFRNLIPRGTCTVRSPLNMVMTVFSQFIKNSIRAMQEAGTSRPVIAAFGWRADSWVTVVFSDSGNGVPDSIRAFLFLGRMVSSNTDATPGRPSGYGIGLVSAKALIDRLGGQISYEHLPSLAARDGVSVPVSEICPNPKNPMAFIVRLPFAEPHDPGFAQSTLG